MSAFSNVQRNLLTRTAHMKIYPTPRTFAQRREVLRVLERYGEVTMFRSLKYHPDFPVQNSFLCIFSDPSAVEAAVEASPVRYRLIADSPISKPQTPQSSKEASSVPQEPEPQPEELLFQLYISQLRVAKYQSASQKGFDHYSYISRNPLYGTFNPIHPNTSFISSALAQEIPKSIWWAGLIDWETEDMVHRHTMLRVDKEDLGDGRPDLKDPNAYFQLRANRRLKNDIPEVMKGLNALRKQHEDENKYKRSE